MVTLQRRWNVAKLLCEKLHTRGYEHALALVDKDDGRMLLDLLYRRCTCYDAEKAIVEATKYHNWTAIKLLFEMCYKDSNNVCKAFELAVEMDRWDVVKLLYQECSDVAVSEVMMQAAARGERTIVNILRKRCSVIDMAAALNQLSLEDNSVTVVPESNPEHQTIRCMVPGNYPFIIDVTSVDTVNDLKALLCEERPDCFGDVPAASIWLYLAKRGDEWLSADSEDISLLELGDSSRVRDLLVWQVVPTRHVKDVFKDVSQRNTIHVLALKPMLRCIIPGSRPFGINLYTITQIEDLKEVIKGEVADDLKNVNASEIQLYLSRAENGYLYRRTEPRR